MVNPSSSATHRVTAPELLVVMPVHNEAGIIARVISDWLRLLDTLEVPYRLNVRNDGSTDNTAAILDQLSHPCLEITHTRNRGHGPTILRAYRAAAERTPWIFQTDSDNELPAGAFPEFWEARHAADLVVGRRTGRSGPMTRKAVTRLLRFLTLGLFGSGIHDVNCPYRLLRSEKFRPLFDELPEDTFAPNVLISGYSLRRGLRIEERSVPFSPRDTGTVSIRATRLLSAVVRSTRQTFAFRFRSSAGKERTSSTISSHETG